MQGLTGFKFRARLMPLQGIFAARSTRTRAPTAPAAAKVNGNLIQLMKYDN